MSAVVDAISLYHHIESEDALLDAIAEHVLARMVVPTRTGLLRTDLVAVAHAFRATALASHCEAATLVLSRLDHTRGIRLGIQVLADALAHALETPAAAPR